jgi:hypothetical protein
MKRRFATLALGIALIFSLFEMSSTPAMADVPGTAPLTAIDCGAFRDVPSQWTVVPNAGACGNGWGYSYILTSPSNVHYATWDFSDGVTGYFGLTVEVWVPQNTGALAQYDYQDCGTGSWHSIGTLNQYADYGWRSPGAIPAMTTVCAVRVHNVGSGTWNLGEDALGFR